MSVASVIKTTYSDFLQKMYKVNNKEIINTLAIISKVNPENLKNKIKKDIKRELDNNLNYLIAVVLLGVKGWSIYHSKNKDDKPYWISIIEKNEEIYTSIIIDEMVLATHFRKGGSICSQIGISFIKKKSIINDIKEDILKLKVKNTKINDIWMINTDGRGGSDIDRLPGNVLRSGFCAILKLKDVKNELGIN